MDTDQFFEQEADHFVSNSKEGDDYKLGLLKELARKGSSFLDIGCGNGYFTDRVLAETNVESAFALDFSGAMLALNQKSPRKPLVRASVLDIPFKSGSFTLVHVDAVLHHLVGATRGRSVQLANRGLREIIRQASPDGFVLISERCVRGYLGDTLSSRIIFLMLKSLSGTWLGKIFHVPQGLMVSFLTPKELMAGIQQAGGRIVRTEVTHGGAGFLFRLALCYDHPRFHLLVSPEGER